MSISPTVSTFQKLENKSNLDLHFFYRYLQPILHFYFKIVSAILVAIYYFTNYFYLPSN